MADVEIVIKLSNKNCEHLKRLGVLWVKSENGSSIVSKALLEGTILPKWHGRLIDADDLKDELYTCETNGRPLHIMDLDERLAVIDEAPTIIEADKENNYADSN